MTGELPNAQLQQAGQAWADANLELRRLEMVELEAEKAREAHEIHMRKLALDLAPYVSDVGRRRYLVVDAGDGKKELLVIQYSASGTPMLAMEKVG